TAGHGDADHEEEGQQHKRHGHTPKAFVLGNLLHIAPDILQREARLELYREECQKARNFWERKPSVHSVPALLKVRLSLFQRDRLKSLWRVVHPAVLLDAPA